jgi:hypothetical protein
MGGLVFYCFWLWFGLNTGIVASETSPAISAALLLLPLIPVAVFDLWLRLSWRQESPTLYPPPPTLLERLLQAEYGLFWFPVLIMIPLWLWSTALIGGITCYWLFG